MKILVLRFSSIGDIVLTTPVVRCIKKQLTGVEVHYATKKSFADIVSLNPYIVKIHLLGESLPELVKNLKAENFDLVIDLHHNLRTLRIKRALGVKSHSFNKLNWQKWLLVNLKINKLPTVHIVDRYLDTTKSLGIKNDHEGLDFFYSANDAAKACDLLSNSSESYVAVVLGANHATKQLPIDKVVTLCQELIKLNATPVLVGGKGETALAQQVINQVGLDSPLINLVGQTSLGTSAAVINLCKAVFTNDTGLMHIAASLKKPVITYWGNTTTAFGMYPYLTQHFNSEVEDLSCRPCSKIGYNKCPKGHFKCMNDQKLEESLSWYKAL